MGGRGKRKIEDFDPNKSDSNDSDYDNAAPTSSARSARNKSRPARPAKPQHRSRPHKRRKQGYGDSDDDIEADSDDVSEDESSAAESDVEEAPVNPSTGRRQRAAARVPKQYEESSEEEEIQATDDEVPLSSAPPPRKQLIVKLRIPSMKPPPRRSRGSSGGQVKRETTPDLAAAGQRRSSRATRNSAEPLLELTGSGRHPRVTGSRPGSAVPEQLPPRPRTGSKGLKKPPSAIMEASHEDLSLAQDELGLDFMSQLQEHATDVEKVAESEPSENGSPEPQPMIILKSDVVPGSDAEADDAQQDEQPDDDEDDDEDGSPVKRKPGRSLRNRAAKADSPAPTSRRSLRQRKAGMEQSSDFEPEAEEHVEENVSDSDGVVPPRRRGQKSDDSSSGAGGRRSTRIAGAGKRGRDSQRHSDEELDIDEIADEAAELDEDRRRNKRPRRSRREDAIVFEPNLRTRSKRPDYRTFRPELLIPDEDDGPAAPPASQRNRRAAAPYRSLFSTLGPFGGAGGPTPVFGGPGGTGAAGGADSDSSDDDMPQKLPRPSVGGAVGMTPTSAATHNIFPQGHNADPAQAAGGGPANLGKVKDKKALADADPLGVDTSVNFDGVGGLGDHIDRLQEMVALPLLYPEVFQQFHVTPPRGVLFHGPPGTGKTLLARALASSVSSHGKKVTFYMRKGADALSKWVGEAERQLRLLFEEARKNQPSIIFFDEIDGLAPVRSSKQEQIHASIVATLLALMDGMDGRGQVIVIGATNRPDSVDPALRRPGRFDREFYFPLPNQVARRAIIDIHTKGWDPPLKEPFKDQLSELTKGYGGADLRALCTEAALNAIQGTYPQIYATNKKLLIDPTTIKVLAKDFMISVNKMIPSSERSASSGAAPLKKSVEPLLRRALADISKLLDDIVPHKKQATALEEAMYDDRDDEFGFEKENLRREFDAARIFRPRLLIRGLQGMGQQYIGAALLSKFEGLHVQNFDLPTLLKDSTRSPEAAVVQLFEEVKRHKPSVIYIPNVDIWYQTLSESVIRTFAGLLRSLPPTDPVLLLGILESNSTDAAPEPAMMRDLFGYSTKNSFVLKRPDQRAREEYFAPLITYISQSPAEFPDPDNRVKRVLPPLPEAPSTQEAPKGPNKEELKAQKRQDRHTLNTLKLHIQLVMDQIKIKYRKFRTPIIEDSAIAYIYDEQNPELLTTDLAQGQEQAQGMAFRPYKLDEDDKGVTGLREVETGKFYYNLEIVTIEKRLSNGYYKRPKDFLADIKRLAKDARTSGDQERTLKANEMLANVEVDMTNLEVTYAALTAECEAVYAREEARERERLEKEQKAIQAGEDVPVIASNVPPHASTTTSEQTSGPVHLGMDVPGTRTLPPFTPARHPLSNGYGTSHNGHSNGSTVPSRPQEDFEMGDSADTSGLTSALERDRNVSVPGGTSFHTPSNGAPGDVPHNATNTHTQSAQKSQHSAHMQLAPHTQPSDYHNSASTTTSGQKTSDRSVRSWPLRDADASAPDFAALPPAGGSQFPATQEHVSPGSQGFSQPSPSSLSQGMPPPAWSAVAGKHAGSVAPLSQHSSSPAFASQLSQPAAPAPAPPAPEPAPAQAQAKTPTPRVILPDPALLSRLAADLVAKSSGLGVEQLEQVMAALMAAVWNTKREWNRNVAAKVVGDAFDECVADIEACQRVLRASQESWERGAGGVGEHGVR